MTTIRINDKEIKNATLATDNASVNDFIEYVLDHYASKNDVLTELKVNGEIVELTEENKYLIEKIDSSDQIEMTVQSSLELAFEALDSCTSYLDIIIEKIQTLTQLYNENKKERANLLFSEIIEIMDLFVQLMSRIYTTMKNSDQEAVNKSKTVQNLEIHLLSVMKALVPAKEKNDIIMLCDLLEYELIDNLTQWKIKAIPELKLMKQAHKESLKNKD